jgi:hypothetical protein
VAVDHALEDVVLPENLVGRRNSGLSYHGWVASPACTQSSSSSPSCQCSAIPSEAALCSNWNSLLFGTNSPR